MSHAALLNADSLTLEDGMLFHTKKGKARDYPSPLAPLADTHGHLTVLKSHDPALALARAALAGVRLLVVPLDPFDDCGCTENDPAPRRSPADLLSFLDEAYDLARPLMAEFADAGLVPPTFLDYEPLPLAAPELPLDLRFVAGSHPYNAPYFDDEAEARMRELLAGERCVGVGEIGLDFGPYNEVDVETQLVAFRRQLAIAHELDLPVELHLRSSSADPDASAHALAAQVLREMGVPAAGCDIHCFTLGPEVAEQFIELGCSIAFGGAVTFGKSDDIRAAAAKVPLDRLLSETDCPFMAPVPLRGEECEPAMVAYQAACVADVRAEFGVSSREETYRALWNNACALFRLS